jgi:hypothetical protein
MPVASVYPSYIAKAEKKGRTRAEVDEIFRWVTGHSQAWLEAEFAKEPLNNSRIMALLSY